MNVSWSEWFWLPSNITWNDFEPRNGTVPANYKDLFIWPFVFMAGILFLRNCIIVPLVFQPFGKWLGIRSKVYTEPSPNADLEQLYKVNRARPPVELVRSYAHTIGWTERKVQRWLRHKALSQQTTTLDKFCENGFQGVYYGSFMIFGLATVATEPFCWDISLAFIGYPQIDMSPQLWCYLMTCMGFYLCQSVTLFTETRKHDFWVMLTHHVCTLSIIVISWTLNYVRICSVSVAVHECADLVLVIGKCLLYAGKSNISNYLGVPFFIIWVITRLIIYPFYLIKASLILSPRLQGGVWPGYFLMNGLNITMLVLHIIWTKWLIDTLKTRLTSTVMTDVRSSCDELDDEPAPESVESSKDK
uniref:Ceramide synthase 5-like n=1 Tax=Hirondellea gigas TaxID=1518452 RepID=A0A2P2I6I1_9CRUS